MVEPKFVLKVLSLSALAFWGSALGAFCILTIVLFPIGIALIFGSCLPIARTIINHNKEVALQEVLAREKESNV